MAREGAHFAARLRRMLVMVPWILQRTETTVAELAERFSVSEDDVVRDLNLVMCCGVPPYGAEHMITVVLDDDGSVFAWKGPFLNRPMRLTPTEGFAVLAAGRGLLAIPGAGEHGPLSSALDKLENALGGRGSVSVDFDTPALLDVVRTAVEHTERLAVSSYSAWRDELTDRVIDPWLVFSHEGRWYVTAADSRSGEVRHFRIDRLHGAHPTGEHFAKPERVQPPERVFGRGADTTEVVLWLPPSGRWVAEAYDPIAVEEGDGGLRVTLLATGERWLERVLLRVGPEAVVESPEAWRTVGVDAARRVAARYAPDSGARQPSAS